MPRPVSQEVAVALTEHSRQADVVLPVFRGLRHVRACLDSLHAAATDVEHRLIVVDDASGEPTASALRGLVAEGWGPAGIVLANPTNLGFLRTANRGMRSGTAPAVVTLNSDTLVADGWLDGLLACLYSASDVGIVSPLSNHANLTRIDVPYGCDHRRIAEAVRRVSPRHYPATTLATGLCLVARREVLVDLDYFDEAYGRGYFEESDLCLRAAERGWRTLADDTTYVHHHGWGSFGPEERTALMERNAQRFAARWGEDTHRQIQRRVRRARPFAEIERRVGLALQDRAQVAPRRELPRSGARSVAERARVSATDSVAARPMPPAWTTWTRHDAVTWQRIATRPRQGETPEDALDVLVLSDHLRVEPWTSDVLQVADRLARDGWQINVATAGTFDPALFVDPCRLRPFVLTGPDEMLEVVPPHRVVLSTSPSTVYDALLLRERDGSTVATWFDPQTPGPGVDWPGEGWARTVAPLLAQAHLGPAIPDPLPEGAVVHPFGLGVDLDVYEAVRPEHRSGEVLLPHVASAGPWATAKATELATQLTADGVAVRVYGDGLDVAGVEVSPFAPQAREAGLLADHQLLVEVGPVPGLDRLRLRCAATGTPAVLASPVGPSCPLRPGEETFVAPRGDVARVAEIASALMGDPAAAAVRTQAARQRALDSPLEAEVAALGTALRAIAGTSPAG